MSRTIFLTGATGYLGGAIARRLIERGDTFHGLTHRAAGAATLERAGMRAVVGDLSRPDAYAAALAGCDALIHAAADHELGAAAAEAPALAAFETAARGGRLKRAIYTSGLWVHGDTGGRVVDETATPAPLDLVAWRPGHEQAFLALAAHGVATAVVRPGIVWGASRGMVTAMMIEAERDGLVRIPGTGRQHWCLVHRDDVATAFVRVLDDAPPRSVYLLEEGVSHPVATLATAIADHLGARTEHIDAARVIETHGAFGRALLADVRVSSAKIRRELAWSPQRTFGAATAIEEWRATRAAAV